MVRVISGGWGGVNQSYPARRKGACAHAHHDHSLSLPLSFSFSFSASSGFFSAFSAFFAFLASLRASRRSRYSWATSPNAVRTAQIQLSSVSWPAAHSAAFSLPKVSRQHKQE